MWDLSPYDLVDLTGQKVTGPTNKKNLTMNFFFLKKIKGWIEKKKFQCRIYLFFKEISKLHILSKILTLVKPSELNNMRNRIANQVKVFVGWQ